MEVCALNCLQGPDTGVCACGTKKTIRETAPPPFAELQEEGEAEWLACDSGEVRRDLAAPRGSGAPGLGPAGVRSPPSS